MDMSQYGNEDSQAMVYYHWGNAEDDQLKAVEYYTKAISLKPDYGNAFYNRGTAYLILKEYDLAILDYMRVIELDAYSLDAYIGCAKANRKIGKNKTCVSYLEQVLDLLDNQSILAEDSTLKYFENVTAFTIDEFIGKIDEDTELTIDVYDYEEDTARVKQVDNFIVNYEVLMYFKDYILFLKLFTGFSSICKGYELSIYDPTPNDKNNLKIQENYMIIGEYSGLFDKENSNQKLYVAIDMKKRGKSPIYVLSKELKVLAKISSFMMLLLNYVEDKAYFISLNKKY